MTTRVKIIITIAILIVMYGIIVLLDAIAIENDRGHCTSTQPYRKKQPEPGEKRWYADGRSCQPSRVNTIYKYICSGVLYIAGGAFLIAGALLKIKKFPLPIVRGILLVLGIILPIIAVVFQVMGLWKLYEFQIYLDGYGSVSGPDDFSRLAQNVPDGGTYNLLAKAKRSDLPKEYMYSTRTVFPILTISGTTIILIFLVLRLLFAKEDTYAIIDSSARSRHQPGFKYGAVAPAPSITTNVIQQPMAPPPDPEPVKSTPSVLEPKASAIDQGPPSGPRKSSKEATNIKGK